MTAKNQNVEIIAGDTLEITIPVKDKAGADVSVEGAVVRWWLGRTVRAGGADVLIRKAVGSGVAIEGATITVSVGADDTAAITPGSYFHECEIRFPDGKVSTPTQGLFKIDPDLIRDDP